MSRPCGRLTASVAISAAAPIAATPRASAGLPLSASQYKALAERLVVYYSGQQRLARDILRRVMGRWLAREPAVLALLDELKQSAQAMRQALLAGRWGAVGRQIERYWRIKKELYPGSTTPAVDAAKLAEGYHFLTVRAFRHRDDGGPPVRVGAKCEQCALAHSRA